VWEIKTGHVTMKQKNLVCKYIGPETEGLTEKYPWHVGALLINHNCINVQKINYGTHRHHTTALFSVVDTAN